ncbi:MAG: hypothetical protein WA323_10190 [Candidatus Nitrosopolaris sp.]
MGHPNTHLCSGSCKAGTCDSQGFCIDDGCGSVIHGGNQCTEQEREYKERHKEKTKGRHKGHNNIHPTKPEQNLQDQYPDQYYPSEPEQPGTVQPIPGAPATPPTQSGKHGQLIDTLTPFKGNHADTNGCFTESSIGRSCRHVSAKSPPVGQNYGVYANFQTKSGGMGKDQPEISITSGGPGSNKNLCCGITTEIINSKSGVPYFRISTEDWTEPALSNGKHTILCSDKPGGEEGAGSCGGNTAVPTNLADQSNLQLSWHVERQSDGSFR